MPRVYNADTNEYEEPKKKTKPTPASNTRKRMKRAAEAKAKSEKPKAKSKAKTKPPIPKDRPKKKSANVKVPKGPTMVGGKRGGSAAHTKGGQGGAKYAKEEGMSALGIQLGVKKKPKAKLSR